MQSSPHPFTERPHQTLIRLSFPVLLSFTAEPITALVDTAFISSLGVVPLAALGVGTTALSSLFWLFNFLGVGAQTEIAQRYGRGEQDKSSEILSLVLVLSLLAGLLSIAVITPTASWLANLLGASGAVQENAANYIRLRLIGAPAVLLSLGIFGALRGIQDMRTPLWIALGINGLNILLDWLLIFGKGPFPALGVQGSAIASSISQWAGALAGLLLVSRKIPITSKLQPKQTLQILQIGGDMVIRTGMLNLFLLYTTRAANQLGPDSGAAHQVLRQMWVFTALALDAFASSAQSLVGYFVGQGSIARAKNVVWTSLAWSTGTGFLLCALMIVGRPAVVHFLVPASAVAVFLPAWYVSAASLPINSVTFLTDGVNLGTGDYRFLRDAVSAASLTGIAGLWLVETSPWGSLTSIWIVIGIWTALRGLLGMLRIWPGIGKSVFARPNG
jgi:MATE family multidrug resistance protein